jgi:hypothetical protein
LTRKLNNEKWQRKQGGDVQMPVIVMVSDREDGRRGEITVADDPRTAAHLVETLLEAGFEQDRIKLFSGAETEIRVSSRPVVALVEDEALAPVRSRPAAEEAPSRSHVEAEQQLAAPREEEWKSEVELTPWVKDGVRFSSLFRAS